MAGYDNGVFEDGQPRGPEEEEQAKTAAADARARDPNGGWQAYGVEGGAVTSKQFDHDYNRYRKLGDQAAQAGPVAVDQAASNQSRGLQLGALGLLQRQADGTADSSANILSRRANENAARAASSQVAGARGVGAGLAAFNGANEGAANTAMAANAQSANERAREVSRGQHAYTAGAGSMRQGDLSVASQNAQLDAQNRALADKQQQHYERMAWDTRNTEMNAANEAMNSERARNEQLRQSRIAENAADWQKTKDVASLGLGAITSDPRGKMRVGSLSSLMRGR